MQPEFFDNISRSVNDDLKLVISPDSSISITAACFSIYAFNELRLQLENIKELRFVFTSPTFTTEKTPKERREFYIPRLNRERSLYGTEFEVKLRNELTQKAIAKECVDWIRSKACFKSNTSTENMGGFLHIENSDIAYTYMPINGFTTVDLGCERGNNAYTAINKFSAPTCNHYLRIFDEIWNNKDKVQDVTEEVIENIATIYKENTPEFIYFMTLYNVFSEFLEDISEDVLPNEATGFKESKIWNMLYNFQQDAALAIINKLERYNGCVLADSVGLGKTFTALAVIKYYENRNKSVLVLCPKKLSDNWNTYKENYLNNPIATDRLRYDVLYHTDLSREHGNSNGIDLLRLNWGNYDLVVIDESHNFRNGGQIFDDEDKKENRYIKLLKKVIRTGVKTKVLMLSATPVNTRFNDLKNQLALAYEGDSTLINSKLNITTSIDKIFSNAQKAFNKWSKENTANRSTQALLNTLSFDFFEMLDSVTIARSRKHIEKYYSMKNIGTFPARLPPLSLRPNLTDCTNAINYNQIYSELMLLSLSIYTPSAYIHESCREKYEKLYSRDMGNTIFFQADREIGIRHLMSVNLLKRLESSVHAFRLTLQRILNLIVQTIEIINQFEKSQNIIISVDTPFIDDFDADDQNTDIFYIGKKVKIDLRDMNYLTWKQKLEIDKDVLNNLLHATNLITAEHDKKLCELFKNISYKIENPINPNNKKILIFTAFSDTANYLYENISNYILNKYGLNSALVTGSIDGKTNILKFRPSLNNILTCFSPISKDKELLMPNSKDNIDILIATDCISEGQNLQDCDYVINYDIHWNPVRIIQRFGRIDRLGSKNTHIQMVNFWPDLTLDEYINLKSRVETRMKVAVMSATGDDDLLNAEEKGDLDYRKQQLERLQNEVVDMEEMNSGISILDLGLNEFRLDLLAYIKTNPDLDKAPFGMHALVPSDINLPQGLMFVLKNVNNSVNIDNQNRLHPFYFVYIANDGTVICNHLSPKDFLNTMRLASKGKDMPYKNLCRLFNKTTKDGKKMQKYSALLGQAISSIIKVKEEKDIDSLFSAGGTSVLLNEIKGLDDFELLCFLIIAGGN